LRQEPPVGDTAEGGSGNDVGRSFGIAEFGVHPDWRRQGLASLWVPIRSST
jgi:GNAT superfamily N-acetyltransferase